MRLSIFLLFLLFLLFNSSYGQEPTDITSYSQSQSIDTSIRPDYFQVEIGVCEYYQYGKRKQDVTKITLDSVKLTFFTELQKLGIKRIPSLTKISGRDYQTYTQEELFIATYEFQLNSIDSVEMLYKSLVSSMPIPSIKRIRVVPQVTPETIKKAQIALEAIALKRAKSDAQNFADSNNFKIQKIESYQLSFIKKERFDEEYLTQQNKAISISYVNPVYLLNVYYSFKLK